MLLMADVVGVGAGVPLNQVQTPPSGFTAAVAANAALVPQMSGWSGPAFGLAGCASTCMVLVFETPLPQPLALVAYTVMVPEVVAVLVVTVILLVPLPAVTVKPLGINQVYPVVLVVAAMLYDWVVSPAQIGELPLTIPAAPGFGKTTTVKVLVVILFTDQLSLTVMVTTAVPDKPAFGLKERVPVDIGLT